MYLIIIRIFSLLFAVLILCASAPANVKYIFVNEDILIKLSETKSLYLHSLNAEKSQADIKNSMYKEKFAPYLGSEITSNYSNNPSFTNPSPESTNGLTFNLGVSQSYSNGITLKGGVFRNSSSFEKFTVEDFSVAGAKISLEIDLWKNFWGRFEKNILASNLAEAKKSELIRKIRLAEHKQDIRSLYWQLVANNEIRKLRLKIIESVDKQKKDITKQKEFFVSDQSDVTRFSALKEQQKSALIMSDYKRELIEHALKNFFPEFRGMSLNIGNPNIDKPSKIVMNCINSIANFKKMPPITTSTWVKVLKTAEFSSNRKLASNKTYSSPEIKLNGSIQYSDYNAELNDVDVYDKDPYRENSITLAMNIPLSSAKSKSEKQQEFALAEAKIAEVENYKSVIAVTHEKTLRLIELLNQVLKTQSEVNKLNASNLELARKKFNRAELPLVQLINDETNFLQGKVSEVETKLLIVNTLLDYLKVFDEYKCEFNK